jgi:hypothetical protein
MAARLRIPTRPKLRIITRNAAAPSEPGNPKTVANSLRRIKHRRIVEAWGSKMFKTTISQGAKCRVIRHEYVGDV